MTTSWKWLYKTGTWSALRASQLRQQPLCETCLASNRIVAAIVAHHIVPHKGDKNKFYNGKLKSLCKKCHDSIEQSYEKLGYYKEIGKDGWPIDITHPVYLPVVSRKK